jgi:hypothetical protein
MTGGIHVLRTPADDSIVECSHRPQGEYTLYPFLIALAFVVVVVAPAIVLALFSPSIDEVE